MTNEGREGNGIPRTDATRPLFDPFYIWPTMSYTFALEPTTITTVQVEVLWPS